MKYSFCSFSFHRLLGADKQDVFQYINDSKALGAAELDPWNYHFAPIKASDDAVKAGGDASKAVLTPDLKDYLATVRDAAIEAGMPWGCIACDGAHIYEEDEAARKMNRAIAFRYLEIAEFLGARLVRIDAGGPDELPDKSFKLIVEGYGEVISRANDLNVMVVTENHWGPTKYPGNVIKLLENIEGLGFLFDTNNWAKDYQQEGWERCAKYADATHIKTFQFDENGWDSTVDLKKVIDILVDTGYDGVWGIESCPKEIDEMTAARKTVELIRMALA